MPRLSVILLFAALLARLVDRLFPVRTVTAQSSRVSSANIKVLITCPSGKSWYDTAVHILVQSNAPRSVRIYILIECETINDTASDDVDDTLRGVVEISHVKAPNQKDDINRIRRLIRRNITGDEDAIVCVDYRARLVRGWDSISLALLSSAAPNALISSPTSSSTGAARFPTRMGSDNGTVFRGLNREFKADESLMLVPSVCWCSEFCIFKPKMLENVAKWHNSVVAQTREFEAQGLDHMVPCTPLIEFDDRIHADITMNDVGTNKEPLHKYERMGLTKYASDAEKIIKFGSSRAARLAVQFM